MDPLTAPLPPQDAADPKKGDAALAVDTEPEAPEPEITIKARDGRWSSHELKERLFIRFGFPEYLWCEEWPAEDEKGRTRLLDGMAFQLYESRGHELIGFEIKVSRNDWLTEMKDPDKATAGTLICDRFFLVCPKGVIQPGELPPRWGLIHPSGTGLRIVKAAELLHGTEPLKRDSTFVARMIRMASGTLLANERRRAADQVRKTSDTRVQAAERKASRLHNAITAFQTLLPHDWHPFKTWASDENEILDRALAKRMAARLSIPASGVQQLLRQHEEALQRVAERAQDQLAKVREAQKVEATPLPLPEPPEGQQSLL